MEGTEQNNNNTRQPHLWFILKALLEWEMAAAGSFPLCELRERGWKCMYNNSIEKRLVSKLGHGEQKSGKNKQTNPWCLLWLILEGMTVAVSTFSLFGLRERQRWGMGSNSIETRTMRKLRNGRGKVKSENKPTMAASCNWLSMGNGSWGISFLLWTEQQRVTGYGWEFNWKNCCETILKWKW